MKKIILIQLLLLFTLISAAQLKPYKIDDSVQVSLPADYKKTDTLGQTVVSASTQFGNILIIKTPDDPSRTPDIEKEKNLNDFYKNYLQKIKSSTPQATISDEKDTIINNLLYKDFTLAVDSGSGRQLRDFRVVHVNGATYTFEFLYQDIHKTYAAEESRNFLNSIKIPPDATLENQFTSPENTTGKPPAIDRTGLITAIIGAVVLIVIILIIMRRRKRH